MSEDDMRFLYSAISLGAALLMLPLLYILWISFC